MGLSAALALSARALETFSAGIQVTGQNIANANSPDYIREKLIVATGLPYRQGGLILGTGVQTLGIRQQIDKFLETRIHSASADTKASEALAGVYAQLETAVHEYSESDLSTALTRFLSGLNDVANQPESLAFREVAVREGHRLASEIQGLRERVDELRTAQSGRIGQLVDEANELIDRIGQLNQQILAVEAGGLLPSDAGGLRSQRYAALNRLSEIIPIRTVEQPNGFVDVFHGSDYLVLSGTTAQHLQINMSVDRGVRVAHVLIEKANAPLIGIGGELGGLLSGRDNVLGGFTDDLDQFASQLIFEFNKLHAAGEGLVGHTSLTAEHSVDDVNAALSAAGLPFAPVHGILEVRIRNLTTGLVTTAAIDVDLDGLGTDDTAETLRAKLDAVANLSAGLTADRRLTLDAAAGFEIRFGADSSGVLAALGLNSFFTGVDSRTIGMNANVLADGRLLAAGRGGGPADGSNVVDLARVADRPLAALGGLSVEGYYASMISRLAQSSSAESALADGSRAFRESLISQRAQFSGVSIDEELLNMMNFQRAFQTAARFISTIDELHQVLINL